MPEHVVGSKGKGGKKKQTNTFVNAHANEEG
jgi:hypothetical protein